MTKGCQSRERSPFRWVSLIQGRLHLSGPNKFRARELFRAVGDDDNDDEDEDEDEDGVSVVPETRARSLGNYILQNCEPLARGEGGRPADATPCRGRK